jgi:hypothetical protein
VKFIHAPLITDPQINQQHTSQSGGESRKVDKKGAAVPFEIAEDHKKVVVDHGVDVRIVSLFHATPNGAPRFQLIDCQVVISELIQ